jgi:hypothetical protein
MNVMIIPEDPTNDHYLLLPLFERLFASIRRPQTKVTICLNPRMRGIEDALNTNRLRDVVARYPMIDYFILCVDRDGNRNRRDKLNEIEQIFIGTPALIAENAWEELETWALAGLRLPRSWTWADVRAEVSVKERYFTPLAQQMQLANGPGGGRKELGILASRRIPAIRRKCPEDFGNLATRLKTLLAAA